MQLLVIGGSRDARNRASRLRLAARDAPVVALDAATLPFVRPTTLRSSERPSSIVVDDFERACSSAQTGGIRLVLTQSTYLVQTWLDFLPDDGLFIATADRDALERHAPEALQGRGPWGGFEIVDLDGTNATAETADIVGADLRVGPGGHRGPPPHLTLWSVPDQRAIDLLVRAYTSPSLDLRVQLCRDAALTAPDSPVAALALASACRERQDPAGARDALDEALRLAPDWAAAHYEDGKLRLADDDLPRARDAFQRACDLMPTFSAAFSNLGAALGELDEPEAALAAFELALQHDPRGFTILNNIGVVNRELGRLDRSEAALGRAIEIAPDFVFGYYNLGHTLFLEGRYDAALAAYEEGQRRDADKNRRQGCRLAVVRFASGDIVGAERDLRQFANEAPADEREDLLLEAYEIVNALLTERPDLDPGRAFLEHIGREIAS